MPLTVTPTVQPSTKTVSVLVSGGTPPYVLTCTPAGGSPYTVKGTFTGTSPNLTKVDAEAKLNIALQYAATDAALGSASAAPVTVVATSAYLSDALDYTQIMDVVVVSQPPNSWEARTKTWDVIGRQDPFVSISPLRLRTGDLVVRMTPAQRVTIQALLGTGNPLLLRSPFSDATDDVVFAVQSVREDLVLPELPNGDRLVTLTYQAVSRDLGTINAGARTYAILLAEATNYTNLLVKFARYDDVRTGLQR